MNEDVKAYFGDRNKVNWGTAVPLAIFHAGAVWALFAARYRGLAPAAAIDEGRRVGLTQSATVCPLSPLVAAPLEFHRDGQSAGQAWNQGLRTQTQALSQHRSQSPRVVEHCVGRGALRRRRQLVQFLSP